MSKTIMIDGQEWQLVPVVPTDEIAAVYGNDAGAYQTAQELHAAMLEAAPEAPSDDADCAARYRKWREETAMKHGYTNDEIDSLLDAAIKRDNPQT